MLSCCKKIFAVHIYKHVLKRDHYFLWSYNKQKLKYVLVKHDFKEGGLLRKDKENNLWIKKQTKTTKTYVDSSCKTSIKT